MDKLLSDFQDNGFAVVNDVFTRREINDYRQIANEYFSNSPSLAFNGGRCLCGYCEVTPELKQLNNLHKDDRIRDIVKTILGEGYIFAEHSDLHQNKLTVWHRDLLMGAYAAYQTSNTWDDNYKIIKICVLLQDHVDNDHGLWFNRRSNKKDSQEGLGEVHVNSKAEDVIVFDQRISHRGQLKQYKEKYGQDRYLITFGYGSNNDHTKQHMNGTIARQQDQRRQLTHA